MSADAPPDILKFRRFQRLRRMRAGSKGEDKRGILYQAHAAAMAIGLEDETDEYWGFLGGYLTGLASLATPEGVAWWRGPPEGNTP